MASTPEQEQKKPRAWRAYALVLGTLVLLLVVFDRLERVFEPDPPAAEPSVAEASEPQEPVRLEVLPTDDGLEVAVGRFYRTTIRLAPGDESGDDMAACIQEGIDRAVEEGRLDVTPETGGWLARQIVEAEVVEETNQIVHQCFLASSGMPELLELPTLPD